jgi:alpha-tubulin suppressor-like RCC1 family protein
MISNKFISDAVNAKVAAGSLTDLELTQLTGTVASLKSAIVKVNAIADLPNAANNLGRMIYVIAEEDYYFSDGVDWGIDYSTTYSTSSAEYSWGPNDYGQLGDGTTTSKRSPGSIIPDLVWRTLSASKGSISFTTGITTANTGYAWGQDQWGALGNGGFFSSKLTPTLIAGGLSWSQIASAANFSVGVTTTGVAYAWGENAYGVLGNGDTNARQSPVSVLGGITFTQMSAGFRHSVGLASGGAVWAWGRNNYGQLGIGSTTPSSALSPVSVVGGLTFTQVSAGYSHNVGIANTGVAYSWGTQATGRLGDGVSGYNNIASPKSVVGGLTWSQVSAGGGHTLAITTGGVAYAWGDNGNGRLGDGTATTRASPVTVVGGITNWSQVSAGTAHSLGVTSAGTLYAWGNNDGGQLGDGTISAKSSPVTVIGGLTGWNKISAGRHSLAILVVETGIA